MSTIPADIDQEAPDLFIILEDEKKLKERGLKRIITDAPCKHLATVENTLLVYYGLRPFYCIASEDKRLPFEESTFHVYVSHFVNFNALTAHLKQHGFHKDTRNICFIDGSYDANDEADEEETESAPSGK
jgi:hypothetical protein